MMRMIMCSWYHVRTYMFVICNMNTFDDARRCECFYVFVMCKMHTQIRTGNQCMHIYMHKQHAHIASHQNDTHNTHLRCEPDAYAKRSGQTIYAQAQAHTYSKVLKSTIDKTLSMCKASSEYAFCFVDLGIFLDLSQQWKELQQQ